MCQKRKDGVKFTERLGGGGVRRRSRQKGSLLEEIRKLREYRGQFTVLKGVRSGRGEKKRGQSHEKRIREPESKPWGKKTRSSGETKSCSNIGPGKGGEAPRPCSQKSSKGKDTGRKLERQSAAVSKRGRPEKNETESWKGNP